jgi:hypothetical protein
MVPDEHPMVDFSNIVAALAGVVGLFFLVVGRVPIPGRNTGKGVFVRFAGALLLMPWPASQGLALLAKVAREMDGDPPDKPETVQLITAFVQFMLMFLTAVPSLVLIVLAMRAPSPPTPLPRGERGENVGEGGS